jgi:hypothetical protein
MIEAESIAARTEIKTIEAVNTHKNTGLVFPTMPPLTAFNQNLALRYIINYINKILIHSLIIPKNFNTKIIHHRPTLYKFQLTYLTPYKTNFIKTISINLKV